MPWQSLAESKEQYSLRWETKYLMELGEAFDYILNGAISMATQEALKYTIISGNSMKMESFFCNSMHVKINSESGFESNIIYQKRNLCIKEKNCTGTLKVEEYY